MRKRTTLELQADDAAALDSARDLSGLRTYARTMRVAIVVLDALLRERAAGARLTLERPGQPPVAVTLPEARGRLDWIRPPGSRAGGDGPGMLAALHSTGRLLRRSGRG